MCIQPLLEAPTEEAEEGPAEYVSFFKPNVTINLVEDFTRCADIPFLINVEASLSHLLCCETNYTSTFTSPKMLSCCYIVQFFEFSLLKFT